MTRIITLITVMAFTLIASAQDKYTEGMTKAFTLWGEGKPAAASDLFERIASAEKNNWLPNYYVALVNTTTAFQTQDKAAVSSLLDKAQNALDQTWALSPDNAELNILQALIYTAWIVYDPMTNGMVYSQKASAEYDKARKLQPDNPRVVFGQAELEIGSARYFGKDVTPMCKEIDRAVALFATFKSDVPFYPDWGADRAKQAQAECGKR